MVRLLSDVADELIACAGDKTRVMVALARAIYERISVMHERAQAAEGRAAKAEARLARISLRLGSSDAADDVPVGDLFGAVCRLDDVAEWLSADYPDEAARLRSLSVDLKGYIVISLPTEDSEL